MANSYFKILNNSIQNEFKENIISEIQNEFIDKSRNLNIYDMFTDIKKSDDKKTDLNTLLKYYVLNQIISVNNNNIETRNKQNVLSNTTNPDIKINNKDNKFYKLVDERYVLSEEIETVNEDGSYIVIENKNKYSYKIKKHYSVEHLLLSFQLIYPNGVIETNKNHVVELLGMKKEFVEKFKYTGYSGNSKDFIAGLLNKLTTPEETGYYMDKQCQLFKWSERNHKFIVKQNSLSATPLLTDYEFINNKVIKKEYTGINK